jgi:hypothetical protein
MDFLNHPSAKIREDAKDTLAFLLECEDDRDTLKKKAAEKLAELENESS